MRTTRGFSILELICCVGILATSILLIMGIYLNMLGSSQKAVDLTSSVILASSLLDQACAQVNQTSSTQAFWQRYVTATTPAQVEHGNYTLNSQTFFYTIYATDVNLTQAGAQPTVINSVGVTNNQMLRLDIVMWWNSDSTGATMSTGTMGQTTITMSRLMWPTTVY